MVLVCAISLGSFDTHRYRVIHSVQIYKELLLVNLSKDLVTFQVVVNVINEFVACMRLLF